MTEDEIEQDRDLDLHYLKSFVYELVGLIEFVVEDGRVIPDALFDDVKAAWAQARLQTHELVKEIDEAGKTNTKKWSALERHGLTGQSLRAKYRAWKFRLYQFGRRMNRRWLAGALRWGNTILGSLVSALGIGGAISEFKEVIENFLADAEADGEQPLKRASKKR